MAHVQGLLLERHCPVQGVTTKLRVAINFSHACLELQPADAPDEGGRAQCLRTLHSLDEALAALRGQVTQLAASPSGSPTKTSHLSHRLPFQSPAKPPRRQSASEVTAVDGVAMVQTCSSAQLREGATMMQAAAVDPAGAAACVEAGAMEALVAAAASVLPSTIMGTTEQLTLLTLTVSMLLDAAGAARGRRANDGAARLVGALGATLQSTCANPILLCKLLVALLQRPDVRLEAAAQGLATTISETYLRKSPLLEPLAAALLSPSAGGRSPSVHAAGGSQSAAAAPPAAAKTLLGGAGGQMQVTPRLPGVRLSVPRLCLRSEESPGGTPSGGLTRATRRELSMTPTEWSSPSDAPWGTPRPRSAAKDTSAVAEMSSMAEALGESLMAMDLPATVAHKRRADVLKTPELHAAAAAVPQGRRCCAVLCCSSQLCSSRFPLLPP